MVADFVAPAQTPKEHSGGFIGDRKCAMHISICFFNCCDSFCAVQKGGLTFDET